VPFAPTPATFRQVVRHFDVHHSRILPVSAPPVCGVHASHLRGPRASQGVWNRTFHLLQQSSAGDAQLPARFQQAHPRAEVLILGAVIGSVSVAVTQAEVYAGASSRMTNLQQMRNVC
jgi:hypothetical protein